MRFYGGCHDQNLQIAKYTYYHSIEECGMKCAMTPKCRDFAMGKLDTMMGFCYLYRIGCQLSADMSTILYSITGCDHCQRELFKGGCKEHLAKKIEPSPWQSPQHSVETCKEKCRGAKGCAEFSIGISPAIADGSCYLYTANCTSDENVMNFKHYAIYGCADIEHDQVFDRLTCTEHGFTFAYFNSHTMPYVNLLKLDALSSDPLLRHRTRDHSSISTCGTLNYEHRYYNLTLNYTDCYEAVSVVQNKDVIIRRAVVEIQENKNALNYVIRHLNHTQYTVECKYTREYSLNGTFNVTIEATVIERNIERQATFNIDMNLYDTGSFHHIAPPPKQVTLNEPIYVEIAKQLNDTNLKMVVQDCWAADEATEEDSNYKYAFYDNGCPLDPTFITLAETDNIFRFKIDAFVLLSLKGQTYLTCSLFVCTASSDSAQCKFGCNKSRKRRSIGYGPVSHAKTGQEVLIRNRRNAQTSIKRSKVEMGIAISNVIKFAQKPICAALKCPLNSECIENYPAFCRCQGNLVMDTKKQTCTDKNLVKMSVPTELTWISEYSNEQSNVLLGLLHTYQEKMLNYFIREKRVSGIRGLKIATANNVTNTSTATTTTEFRVIMSLEDDVTKQGVAQQMQDLLITQTNEIVDRTQVNPSTIVKIIQVVIPGASGNTNKLQLPTQDITLIVVGIAAFSVILFAIWALRRKRDKEGVEKKVVVVDHELNAVTANSNAE